MIERQTGRVSVWVIGGAVGAAAAAASYSIMYRLRRRRMPQVVARAIDELELAAVEALRRDAVTSGSPIDVAVLAPGMVELTGRVPDDATGQRAARLLHALPGVRTVINRLVAVAEEERLAENRARRERADPPSASAVVTRRPRTRRPARRSARG
jgi:hypothetical protein